MVSSSNFLTRAFFITCRRRRSVSENIQLVDGPCSRHERFVRGTARRLTSQLFARRRRMPLAATRLFRLMKMWLEFRISASLEKRVSDIERLSSFACRC